MMGEPTFILCTRAGFVKLARRFTSARTKKRSRLPTSKLKENMTHWNQCVISCPCEVGLFFGGGRFVDFLAHVERHEQFAAQRFLANDTFNLQRHVGGLA